MKGHTGKEAFSRPVKMIKDKFGSKQKAFEDGPELLDLKQASRKTAKSWNLRKVSKRCYTEYQGAKVNHILGTILAVLIKISNLHKYLLNERSNALVSDSNLLKH